MPEEVALWFGLDSNPAFYPGSTTDSDVSLAELNDPGASFDQIADVIEEHFLTEST